MTPEAFVSKWSQTTTKERASAQEHFIDICRVLGEKTPNEADPTGEWYAFEKGVERTGKKHSGWADVWKRGHFGWEYKSKSGGRERTMSDALKQLQLYALALESPPLLIVSDIDTIEIHTSFQNAVQEVHVITLAELSSPKSIGILRAVFKDPERLRPKRTRNQITTEAAGKFAQLAFELRQAGHEPYDVAHFINKILFCMFAEDIGVLKTGIFTDIVEKGVEHPEHFDIFIKRLFQAMQKGGPFGTEIIDWFNGGLYDDDQTLPLSLEQIRRVRDLSHMDWSQIEPAIFGTLFERGLDPEKRGQLGAHYTDSESIMRLVNPTIVSPLLDEWEEIKKEISKNIERMEKVRTKAATEKRRKAAMDLLIAFLERLRNFKVLDPACGSGNFLYLSLLALKDIEHRVNIEAESMGLLRQNPLVDPENVLGIELSRYAAELARVTVWIGELQWMIDHGYPINRTPILKHLKTIEQRDALLANGEKEADWPEANVIVGNPPFLGGQKQVRELGDYAKKLRAIYRGRVPASADLVTYWFEKAGKQLLHEKVDRVGLVATQSIRKGTNNSVIQEILNYSSIFCAWSDEPWINEGASVRVSLLCLQREEEFSVNFLNGSAVEKINADLSAGFKASEFDITDAVKMRENSNLIVRGSEKGGAFDVPGDIARKWLALPANPNGQSNSVVLRPWVNASDITGRNRDIWLIDFGINVDQKTAAGYEAPYAHAQYAIQDQRSTNTEARTADKWWLHRRSGAELKSGLANLTRYIATPRVAKHRIFVWMHSTIVPDSRLFVVLREDDATFGILHSKIHHVWTMRTCSWHGKGNDPTYNAASCFETFPFPIGLEPNRLEGDYSNSGTDEISSTSKNLAAMRDRWLNPQEWTNSLNEFPDIYGSRIVAKEGHENDLRTRTMTNLYNNNPHWLRIAHAELDEAVAAAYGWSVALSDDDIFANLLALNVERARNQ